jgi:hypothetical protein
MSELQETMNINGYKVTFCYDRDNPQYIVYEPFYAKSKREIMFTLQAIWRSRGYEFLTQYYNYHCSQQLQFKIWTETLWRYRRNPRENNEIIFKNKYSILQRLIITLRAWLAS